MPPHNSPTNDAFTHTNSDLLPVLAELRHYEPIFHTQEFGLSTAECERRMAPDYWEVGASGRRYSRKFILRHFEEKPPIEARRAGWSTSGHALRPLGPETFLVTYTLRQGDRTPAAQPSGGVRRRAGRSCSIRARSSPLGRTTMSCLLSRERIETMPVSVPIAENATTPTEAHARNIRRTRLPNGLLVLTESIPHVRSVSMGVWIDSGSRDESLAHNGISHFVEHMVFKGTTSRSAQQFAREADSIGGNLDAFTGKEIHLLQYQGSRRTRARGT